MIKKLLFLFITMLFAHVSQAAYITLDIINLDKTGAYNFCRWAYPGVKYEIPVAIEGGLYPFSYELTTAPTGMTISTEGIIEWDTPTIAGSPHTVTVRVVDAEGEPETSTISITVTDATTRYLFVDASDTTSTETGAIGEPFKTLDALWVHTVASGGTEFAYIKDGTYTLPHSYSETAWITRYAQRVALGPRGTGYDAVNALVAYPGYSPVIDLEGQAGEFGGIRGYLLNITNANDIFVGGLNIDNAYSYAMDLQSNDNYLTLYNNSWTDIATDGAFDGNYAYISSGNGNHNYTSIIGNNFGGNSTLADPADCSHIKFYTTYHSVTSDNDFHGMHGVDYKTQNTANTFRHNRLYDAQLQQMGYVSVNDTDVSFNFFSGTRLSLYLSASGLVTDLWFYRNTLYNSYAYFRDVESADSIYMLNNVMAYDQVDTGLVTNNDYWRNRGHYDDSPSMHELSVLWTGGVYENIAENVIDSSGLLQGSYATTYLGVAGWETSATVPVAGVCGSEAAQLDTRSYSCTSGVSTNHVDGASATTWDCEGTGGSLVDDNCSAAYSETVDPVCDSTHRSLCTALDCETTGEGYWYNDTCNATAEPTGTITAYSLTNGDVTRYKLTTE